MSHASVVKPGFLFAPSHEWAKVEGNKAKIGISDFAQHALGEIVFVDLPKVGQVFKKEGEFGAVESVKAASELYMPLSGKVIAVNKVLEDQPELINKDSYDAWMVEIELTSPSEVSGLLSPDAYLAIAK